MSMPDIHNHAALRAEGLTLSRGGRVLVRELSLNLQGSEALVLTGANGSGKTTLLRAMAGLVRPDGGVITAPASSYLGHADGLKSSETVHEALSFWAALDDGTGKADPRLRDELASALGIRTLYLTPCQHLSAGQKRRVALVRMALKREARLWLMDEPAAPLDLDAKALLGQLVADFRAKGGMVVAATHADLGWPDVRTLEIRS